MQIQSMVFALSRQLNKQKVCENNNLPCTGNEVLQSIKRKGEGVNPNPPPLRTHLIPIKRI